MLAFTLVGESWLITMLEEKEKDLLIVTGN